MTNPTGTEAASRRGEDIDPEIRAFVRAMGAGWAAHPDLSTVSPSEARRIADAVREPWTRGGPAMTERAEARIETKAGPVRVRRYVPVHGTPAPGLVWLHGGGWTIFSLDTHDRVMRELAARSGVTVVGVDYALSPEAKHPIALGQSAAVLEELLAGRGGLGVDPARIAVGGDSAGANLSVAACLKLRDAGAERLPAAMALVYGVFDRRSSPESAARYGGAGYMLGASEMEQFWTSYLVDERQAEDPLVCPVRADLAGLPPAFLTVPECDLLAEQSHAMAARLRAHGVDARLEVYPGATHSFLEAVAVSTLAGRALDDLAAWLRSALGLDGR